MELKNIKTKDSSTEKLIGMAKVIINAIKNAKKDKDIQLCDAAWVELEMEWFDWLNEELTEDTNQV